MIARNVAYTIKSLQSNEEYRWLVPEGLAPMTCQDPPAQNPPASGEAQLPRAKTP
jgi:hypothetical protein